MIVAEKAGEILAVAASLDDKVAFLWVHPAHYRKGIGSAMLDIVETELKKSGFKTASWNVSAITTGPWDFTWIKAGSSSAKRWTKKQAP